MSKKYRKKVPTTPTNPPNNTNGSKNGQYKKKKPSIQTTPTQSNESNNGSPWVNNKFKRYEDTPTSTGVKIKPDDTKGEQINTTNQDQGNERVEMKGGQNTPKKKFGRKKIDGSVITEFVMKTKNRLMTKNGYASYAEIMGAIAGEFEVNYYQKLGNGHPAELKLLNGIKEMNNKMAMYIDGYIAVCSMWTLADLESDLKSYMQVSDLNELFLVSIKDHPTVKKRLLRISNDLDDIRITSRTEVMEYLRIYKKNLKKKKADAQVFINKYGKELGCSGANTGVIIRSIPFCISIINTVERTETKFYNDLKKKWRNDYQADENIQILKKEYLESKVADTNLPIQKWKKNGKKFLDMIISTSKVKTYKEIFEAILLSMNSMSQCRSVIALCTIYAVDKIEEMEYKKIDILENEPDSKKDVSFELILLRCREFFEKQDSAIEKLYELEKYLCQFFSVQSFREFGYGSFIGFITEEFEDVLQMNSQSLIDPEDLLDFVTQILKSTPINKTDSVKKIQMTLCDHYKVKNMSMVSIDIDKVIAESLKHDCSNICYQTSLFEHEEEVEGEVGIFGYISRDQVINTISNMPFLTDIHQWLCWDQVYERQFGSLKSLLILLEDFLFMEITPGIIIKLDRSAEQRKFRDCLNRRDSFHLAVQIVSLVAKSQNIEDFSLSLYCSYLKTELVILYEESEEMMYLFILSFMRKIPVHILMRIANFLILKTVGEIDVQYKKKLLEYCSSKRELTMIHRLGMFLDIGEWKAHFRENVLNRTSKFEEFIPKMQIIIKEVQKIIPSEYVPIPTSMAIDSMISGEPQKKEIAQFTSEENSQYQVIMNISSNYDIKNNNEQVLRGYSQAIKRLSSDLYSEDIHFVLELVQNADDNRYEEDNPSLKISITNDSFVVENNEVGFEEKNVRALCDVGGSTKEKEQSFIGQKGIGFKSVFKITDSPEIHSRGYHFKFDKENGKLGYICPIWIDTAEEFNWTTTIILPINEEKKSKIENYSRQFEDIDPSILLFLNRLKNISIDDCIKGIEREMQKTQIDEHIVKVTHGSDELRWMVVKKSIDQAGIREGSQVTVLQLAFPLSTEGSSSSYQLPEDPSKQSVFAYLPVKEYGFNFIIQGDFIMPSSREDIDNDEAWNQGIRDEIANLFIEAIEIFKYPPNSNDPFNDTNMCTKFFQFIPVEEEIASKFFKPVVKKINTKLKTVECIPTQNGEWVLPHQAVIVPDRILIGVVKDKIFSITGQHFIREDADISPVLIKSLGINYFNGEQLPGLLLEFYKQSRAELGDEISMESIKDDIEWIIDCLLYLDLYLEQTASKAYGIRMDLYKLKLIPLLDGTLTSFKEGHLFIPEDSITFKSPASSIVKSQLRVINNGFLSLDKTGKLVELFKKLGATTISPEKIIETTILPYYKDLDIKGGDDTLTISYLVFLKDYIATLENSYHLIQRIRETVYFLTNQGYYRIGQKTIYIPSYYASRKNLKLSVDIAFPFLDVVFISEKYGSKTDLESWNKFFGMLNITSHLTLTNTPSGDWDSSEIRLILESKKKTRNYFLKMLNRDWDIYYKNCTKLPNGENSSFMNLLQTSQWLTPENEPDEILLPSDIFYPTSSIKRILGNSVPLLSSKISKSLSEDIGVNCILKIDTLMKIIQKWCYLENTPPAIIEDAIPIKIYTFFNHCTHDRKDAQNLRNFFHTHPAFYAPPDKHGKCWYRVSEVFWKDSTNFVDDTGELRILAQHYKSHEPRLEDFFLDTIHVLLFPNFNDYVNVLISQQSVLTPQELSPFLLSLFEYWYDSHQSDKYNRFSFIDNIINLSRPICLTRQETWVPFTRGTFLIANETDLEESKMFEEDVDFMNIIDIPEKAALFLRKTLEVKTFSESVTEIVLNAVGTLDNELSKEVSAILPYMQQFIFSNDHEIYEIIENRNVLEGKLHFLKIQIVEKLDVIYDLNGVQTSFAKTKPCAYSQGSIFINNPDLIEMEDEIYRYIFSELSKIFYDKINWELAEFSDKIRQYLKKNRLNHLQTYLESRKIKPIPFGATKWEILDATTTSSVMDDPTDTEIIDFGDFDSEKFAREFVPKSINTSDTPNTKSSWPLAPDSGNQRFPPSEESVDRRNNPEIIEKSSTINLDALNTPTWSQQSNLELQDNSQQIPQRSKASNDSDFDTNERNKRNSGMDKPLNWAHMNITTTPEISLEKAPPQIFEIEQIETPLQNSKPLNEEDLSNIGRWGEEYIFLYLKTLLPDQEIVWVNETEESGRPYDITVVRDTITEYIEVKTTTTNSPGEFDISPRELSFAESCITDPVGEFFIYRLFEAGLNSKIVIYPCPIEMISENKARLSMKVIQNYQQ